MHDVLTQLVLTLLIHNLSDLLRIKINIAMSCVYVIHIIEYVNLQVYIRLFAFKVCSIVYIL